MSNRLDIWVHPKGLARVAVVIGSPVNSGTASSSCVRATEAHWKPKRGLAVRTETLRMGCSEAEPGSLTGSFAARDFFVSRVFAACETGHFRDTRGRCL
jgi:hypothetical protein